MLLGLFCCVETATAVSAEDLWSMSMPASCTQEYINMSLFLKAKEDGLAKDQAIAISKKATSQDKIDPLTIGYAYANPSIAAETFIAYSLMACEARKSGLPVASLEDVAQEFDECVKHKTDLCWRQMTNLVWKLPRDFVPKPRISVAAPPPPVLPKQTK